MNRLNPKKGLGLFLGIYRTQALGCRESWGSGFNGWGWPPVPERVSRFRGRFGNSGIRVWGFGFYFGGNPPKVSRVVGGEEGRGGISATSSSPLGFTWVE